MKKLFTVFLLATSAFVACKKDNVAPNATSDGALGSATDTCTGVVVSGTYKRTAALTGANTVTLTVNVSRPGSYDISSDTLEGISFRGTGTFTATGTQPVTLAGIGTPTDSDIVRFRVRYGTSSCTFLVKIEMDGPLVVVPSSGDYFPSTTSSSWSYDTYSQTGLLVDTAHVFSTGTFKTISGHSYSTLVQRIGTRIDSFFHRKSGGTYYNASGGTNIFTSGIVQATQVLKDNVPAGSTWADTFAVTVSGQNILVKYDYIILEKGVTATVNNFNWSEVIKVKAVISTNFSRDFVPLQTLETWYARGTGLIYEKSTNHSTTPNTFKEARLRRFIVVP